MKKHYGLFILLALGTGQSWASQYAVQLEASKSPQLDRYEALSVHGRLYTESANNGYIRTRLGPYDSKRRALEVLDEVHAAGYTDAIITKQSSKITTTLATTSATKHQYDIESFDVKTLKEWKMLTPEQQANLVYLDGMLHVKDGNQFIPLNEITGQK